MAGCTESKKAECRAEGKVCNPKTGRCKVPAKKASAAKKSPKRKSPKRASPKRSPSRRSRSPVRSPSTSLVAGAVLEAAPPRVQGSLMRKGRSRTLGGATMGELVDQTKKQVKKMRYPQYRKKKSNLMRVNWSASGIPSEKRPYKQRMQGCEGPCPTTKKGVKRVRVPNPKKGGCKCMSIDSRNARAAGICPMRKDRRTGQMVQTVAIKSKKDGAIRCVKAGGAAAKKAALGDRACPEGKYLKTYQARVPLGKGKTGTRIVTAKRCVKAVGANKDCPSTQVLVEVMGKGVAAGRMIRRCVTPKTAAAKGYRIVARGTLPARRYSRTPATSPGF